MSTQTLVIVGDAIPVASDAGQHPRRDYDALIERLGADVLHAGALRKRRGRMLDGIALARMAARRADSYQHIYCDSEHIGIPLAYLLRRRPNARLTMIAHYLTPAKKRLLVRALRVQDRIDAMIVHAPAQAARARSLGFRDDRVVLLPYQVDARFWAPDGSAEALHIASAGQEFRDYATLVQAARDLPASIEIAAGSHWSKREQDFGQGGLPRNVTVRRRAYPELREMYAAARFVVVPLHDVDFQAGIITILEAMAMGKAVITSRTRGQTGTVSGPLMDAGALRDIGEDAWHEPTGIYVPPGDPAALRQAMDYLLERPDVAGRMGAAGRAHVEAALNLDRFVDRVSDVIAPATSGAPRTAFA